LVAGGLAAVLPLRWDTAEGATDDKIELAKVPARVKEAAGKAMPHARWKVASKSLQEGKVTYELEGEDAAKRYVWAEVTDDAKVNEVGTEIPAAKAPTVVTTALKKKFPRFRVTATYEARHEGKVIRYDFEGKRPRDKEEITVSVSPDGKEVEIEED
jgi:hypothetical protein